MLINDYIILIYSVYIYIHTHTLKATVWYSYIATFLQMKKMTAVSDELHSRFPDTSVEKASKATLQSLLDQHDVLSQDLERELSSLTLLRQYALSLLHDVEVPSPTNEQDELPGLKEIRCVQDKMER